MSNSNCPSRLGRRFDKLERIVRSSVAVISTFWGRYSVDGCKRPILPTLMPRMRYLARMASHGATFAFSESAGPTVSADGITMRIEGNTEVFAFEEVIMNKVYRTTFRTPTVVIDVGMNVGLASLYFAAQPNVVAVYGFEPFKATFESALANFALNPELAKKIEPENSGLDSRAYHTKAGYNPAINWQLGIHGPVGDTGGAVLEQCEIELQSAVDVFNSVRAKHPNAAILIKMDCEGSEREIIPALCSDPSFRDRVALTMETHGCGEEVFGSLEAAGFSVFTWAPLYGNKWLIHAVSSAD